MTTQMTSSQVQKVIANKINSSYGRLVAFSIKNTKTSITVTKATNNSKIERTLTTLNENIVYQPQQYFKVADVVFMSVNAKGDKAADSFYAAIALIESLYVVKSDFINGSYFAMTIEPKIKGFNK